MDSFLILLNYWYFLYFSYFHHYTDLSPHSEVLQKIVIEWSSLQWLFFKYSSDSFIFTNCSTEFIGNFSTDALKYPQCGIMYFKASARTTSKNFYKYSCIIIAVIFAGSFHWFQQKIIQRFFLRFQYISPGMFQLFYSII